MLCGDGVYERVRRPVTLSDLQPYLCRHECFGDSAVVDLTATFVDQPSRPPYHRPGGEAWRTSTGHVATGEDPFSRRGCCFRQFLFAST